MHAPRPTPSRPEPTGADHLFRDSAIHLSHMRLGALLPLCALFGAASALVLPPSVRSSVALLQPRSPPAVAAVRMQVAEPPVKIPDKVPQLAPTEPKGDKQNQKGKKFKLLLFNDNVNRCASAPRRAVHSNGTG